MRDIYGADLMFGRGSLFFWGELFSLALAVSQREGMNRSSEVEIETHHVADGP